MLTVVDIKKVVTAKIAQSLRVVADAISEPGEEVDACVVINLIVDGKTHESKLAINIFGNADWSRANMMLDKAKAQILENKKF